ncbi:MAG TPA: WYL domain-containing protein [Chloroflexota bacterium]|nr:WYL domain-containing protein [Chloroflexota bacterium]HZU04405.1 WYL domain-containing protein [Chloroflexota bacterium]
MQGKRLVADRLFRLWAIVEYIAGHPGCGRRELARRFALSERQLQADLRLIRRELALPLVRRQGYRFAASPEAGAAFTLADAYLLGQALEYARAAALLPEAAMQALGRKLLAVCPVHLRPLLGSMLPGAERAAGQAERAVLRQLGQAAYLGLAVRLYHRRAPGGGAGPVVTPELVMRYGGSWYVLGQCPQTRRARAFRLDQVTAADPVARSSGEEQAHDKPE